MMAAICRVLSCKSKKNEQVMDDISAKKTRSITSIKTDYKQVKKKKVSSMQEVIENITHINRRVRFTIEPDYRYIIPLEFINKIVEMVRSEKYYSIDIRNMEFLHKNKKYLNRTINTEEMCLVSREIMDALLFGLDIDYIIRLPFKGEKGFKLKLKEVQVFREDQFSIQRKEKIRNFDQENNIDSGILLCKDMKIEIENNLTIEEESEEEDKNEGIYQKRGENGAVSNEDEDNVENDKNEVIKISTAGKQKKNRIFKKGADKEEDELDSKSNININYNGKNKKVSKDAALRNNKSASSEKSTTATKKSGNSSAYYINKLESLDHLTLPPKGLYNPSVYCFMNTCMQCLASIPELNYYFSSGTFNVEKKSKKGTTYCNALKDFLNSYEESGASLKPPSSLYKACHSFLEPNQQHDCQEFLRRFLSKIQEELNFNKKYTFPDKINYRKAWSIYREVSPSFVDSLFAGLMRSSVICNKCGSRSDTYDPFLDLSVPIKRKPVETLENCLDNYFAKEFIDCEYKCSSCKKKTSITKKLEIVVSPPILTIHFKRFEDLHHKFNGSIEFSDRIDLLTYTSPDVHDTLHYELFAVAVHLGRSIFSGHYVAYAKRNGKWFHFNDSSVFPAGSEEALSNNAYILFYRRVE